MGVQLHRFVGSEMVLELLVRYATCRMKHHGFIMRCDFTLQCDINAICHQHDDQLTFHSHH